MIWCNEVSVLLQGIIFILRPASHGFILTFRSMICNEVSVFLQGIIFILKFASHQDPWSTAMTWLFPCRRKRVRHTTSQNWRFISRSASSTGGLEDTTRRVIHGSLFNTNSDNAFNLFVLFTTGLCDSWTTHLMWTTPQLYFHVKLNYKALQLATHDAMNIYQYLFTTVTDHL